MNNSTKMALAFLTLSTAVATPALADKRHGDGFGMGGPGGMIGRFGQADSDNNGEITFDEFSKAAGERFTLADVNKDGQVTVAEIAAAIEKMRAERMAKRLVDRFDANSDGTLTLAEIQNGQKEVYALMDHNDDGKLVKEEMPRRGKGHMGRHGSNSDE